MHDTCTFIKCRNIVNVVYFPRCSPEMIYLVRVQWQTGARIDNKSATGNERKPRIYVDI